MKKKPINVMFLGRGVIAENCLMMLSRDTRYNVVAVVSNKDADQYWWKSDFIYRWAVKHDMSVLDCGASLKARDYLKIIKDKKVKLILSVQYCLVVPPEVLRAVNRQAYNLHNAKLPEYCGSFTIAHEIFNGESEHGCTIHQMANRLDAGDIAVERTILINSDDTANTVFWRSVYYLAIPLFIEFLAHYAGNQLRLKPMARASRRVYAKADFQRLQGMKPRKKQEKLGLARALDFLPTDGSSKTRFPFDMVERAWAIAKPLFCPLRKKQR